METNQNLYSQREEINLWEQLQALPYANPEEGKSSILPWIKHNNMLVSKQVKVDSVEYNAVEYRIVISDIDISIKALRESEIFFFNIDLNSKTIILIDVFDNKIKDEDLPSKVFRLGQLLTEYKIKFVPKAKIALAAKYIDSEERKTILEKAKNSELYNSQTIEGEKYRALIDEAIKRNNQLLEKSNKSL